jgi:DNA-binding transcriptional regulator YiaG
MTDEVPDIPELGEEFFARALTGKERDRFVRGNFRSGEDIARLRRFIGLTQVEFAEAVGISVHTLRNWEQGRRFPDGPAISLLANAARHPHSIRRKLRPAG